MRFTVLHFLPDGNYVEKAKTRILIPEGFEISEKPTKNVFAIKYGICNIIRRVSKEEFIIADKNGREIRLNFAYYMTKNQACFVKKSRNE